MQRVLADRFAEDYMGRIFYFCLRKTGEAHEAEDLTSEIAVQVLSELARGTVPQHFNAWVWQIARNRYSAWAKRKQIRQEKLAGDDVYAYEIADDDADVAAETIRLDEIARLRRLLAFISSDYRNIVVAYYIDGRKVREIAQDLGLPTDTVKSRLFRARKLLKEGMGMAKEFGMLSYKPEKVTMKKWGFDGRRGEPWCYVERLFCRNVILAAYRNPSTAEELALEMGVALPYMEDELERLVKAELIRKNGDRYESNIVVVSAEAQERIQTHAAASVGELTRALIDAVTYWTRCQEENGGVWHEGSQPQEDMKWALLMRALDHCQGLANKEYAGLYPKHTVKRVDETGRTIRPDGGAWDLIGFEAYQGQCPPGVGHHTAICENGVRDGFGQYKFLYRGLDQKTPEHLTRRENDALYEAVQCGMSPDEEALAVLERYGYIRREGDVWRPTFWVLFREKCKPLTAEQAEKYGDLVKRATEILLEEQLFCRSVILGEIPDFMKQDAHTVEFSCMAAAYSVRGDVLEEALRTGYLTEDACAEENRARMLGAYLTI